MIKTSKIGISLILVFAISAIGNNVPESSGFPNNELLEDNKTLNLLNDNIVAFDIIFNDTSKSDKKDHLANFAEALKKRTNEIGYVISYAGRKAKANESLRNLKSIKRYLTKKKNIKLQQFVLIDGGYMEKGMTYFYFVPKGGLPPEPISAVQTDEVIKIK